MPRGHYLTEAVKDAIWVLRAEGVSEAEIGRRLGVPKRTVSKYLQRMGGVRPRARRRAECCLTSAEREEISLSMAIGFSPTAAISSPRWRPCFLPTGGHESPHRQDL
jgi:transcriptional regulator with XRE-family HTH domain